MHTLETPTSTAALYAARGDETELFDARPRFTGDVLCREDEMCIILQHPCAIRRGLHLVDRLLLASISPFTGELPAHWADGHFKRFLLPDMQRDGEPFSASFATPVIWSDTEALASQRIAILSRQGVNLLLQRWVHHNTRVVVPTATLNDVTSGPFEEADLISDACQDLVSAGGSHGKAEVLIDSWLGDPHVDGQNRRAALDDSQQRSSIRQQLRTQTRMWMEDRAAHE